MIYEFKFTFLIFIIAIKICGSAKEDCHKYAKCTDLGPGNYKCTCNKGYTGNGKTCTGLFLTHIVLAEILSAQKCYMWRGKIC